MAANTARRLAINPYGDTYPDDNTIKEVALQADGLVAANPAGRHVLLRWTNGTDADGRCYTQEIQLSGGPGNYGFHTPQVKAHSEESQRTNACYVLGQYTREQRDHIVALAKAVKFDRKSYVNNCQVWMRDLIEAMARAGLLSEAEFNKIDVDVPLKKRVAETQEVTLPEPFCDYHDRCSGIAGTSGGRE